MSTLPPSLELNYQTPQPGGNAKMLVKLAAIFNFITSGLDGLTVLFRVAAVIFILYLANHPGAGGGRFFAGPGAGPGAVPGGAAPAGRDLWIQALVQGIPALYALAAGVLKCVAGFWLVKRRKGAWGLALAAGIAGCLEVWSCPCCFAHIACGVYTIVVLCLTHVRGYLQTGL